MSIRFVSALLLTTVFGWCVTWVFWGKAHIGDMILKSCLFLFAYFATYFVTMAAHKLLRKKRKVTYGNGEGITVVCDSEFLVTGNATKTDWEDLDWLVLENNGEWVDGMTWVARNEHRPCTCWRNGEEHKWGRWYSREEFEARKIAVSRKPSWHDAPGWANWLAQNFSGYWTWFSEKPHAGDLAWRASEGMVHVVAGSKGYVLGKYRPWEDTLEQRPVDHKMPSSKVPANR